MPGNLLITLTQNVSLIFSLVFIFGLFLPRLVQLPRRVYQVIFGSIFGLFGILNLMLAVTLEPGILVDLRSPFVVVAGVFSGAVGAFLAAGLIALYRLFVMGGVGALPAAASLLTVALVGIWWFRRCRMPSPLTWLLLGFVSIWPSVIWSLLLMPRDISQVFLASFIPSALLLYPLATLIVGLLIQRECQQHQLTQQLNQNEQKFRAIFDQAFQFIGLLKPDGEVIEANKTALKFAGLSEADVVGKPFWETHWWAVSETARADLQAAIQRAAAGEFVRYQVDVAGTNDETRTIDFSLKPMMNERGQVTLLIPEGRDLTSEIEAQERRLQLLSERQRSALLRAFIRDTSHHLRTPLATLGTSRYLTQRTLERVEAEIRAVQAALDTDDRATADTRAQQALNLTAGMGTRLAQLQVTLDELALLVDHLVLLMQLDQPGETPDLAVIDVVDVVTAHVTQQHDRAAAAAVTLTLAAPPDPVLLPVYPDWFNTLLHELLDNALRYTPAGGSVTVEVSADEAAVGFTVRDSGIGIDPADQPCIFEQFFRADNAQMHVDRGFGLGLALAQKIVQRHQGRIEVTSTPGHGTTVQVMLPRHLNSTAA